MKLFINIFFTLIFAGLISAASGASLVITMPMTTIAAMVTIPSGVLSAKIGAMAAASTTTLQIQYLPEIITFSSPTPPTGLKIEVLGDGTTLNLDAAGILIMNNLNTLDVQPDRYVYQVSNGLIIGKTVEITMENADVNPVDVYGLSPNGEGDAYAVYQKNTILANSGKNLYDFAVIGFAAPTADDIFILEMVDGTQDKLSIEEIDAYQCFQQNYDPSANGLLLNNTEQLYSKLNLTPSTNRSIYVLDFQPIEQIDNEIE